MKAAVLTGLGAPLTLVEGIAVPPLKPAQVLVRIAFSGVCHSQVMEARGRRGADNWLPHMLGHEATGRVVEVGEAVTKVKPGDLVVLSWIRGAGGEAGGCQYSHDGQTINAGGVTTFSDMAVISENRLTLLPEGVPLDVGVLFGCALPTGAGLVLHELQPRPHSSIAIFGVGGIGMCALMASAMHDFAKVIAVDISDEKLTLAASLGAHVTVNSRKRDALAAIREETGGEGADYAVDASGVTQVIELAFAATHRTGTTIFASHPPAGETIALDPHALISGKQIRGSWGGGSDIDRDVPVFAALYRSGKLPLDRLISRRYSLDEINEALDDLEQGRVVRPVIEINPDV